MIRLFDRLIYTNMLIISNNQILYKTLHTNLKYIMIIIYYI